MGKSKEKALLWCSESRRNPVRLEFVGKQSGERQGWQRKRKPDHGRWCYIEEFWVTKSQVLGGFRQFLQASQHWDIGVTSPILLIGKLRL